MSPQRELEEELYAALTEIGTKRKSVRPSVLENYADLFRNTPRVKHQLLPGASDNEVAVAAKTAIMTVLADIADSTDRLMGEAVLAVGQFEGKRVEDRKEIIEAAVHSPHTYKHKRKPVLATIVGALARKEPPPPRLPEPQVITSSPKVAGIWWLRRLGLACAELQFRGLSSLFVAHFHYVLEESETPFLTYRYPDSFVIWDECARHLFDGFAQFLAEFESALAANSYNDPIYGEHFPLIEIEDQLPEFGIRSLADLYRSALGSGPKLGEIKQGLVVAHGKSANPGRLVFLFREVFEKVWLPWYYKQVVRLKPDTSPKLRIPAPADIILDGTGSLSGVEQLVATAAAAERFIQAHVSYGVPVVAEARRRAHKTLAHYYDFDEWLPVIRNTSLQQHIDMYFDRKLAELAKSDIV